MRPRPNGRGNATGLTRTPIAVLGFNEAAGIAQMIASCNKAS